MKVITNALVSNSEITRNYKACRDKAEKLGKIFIIKNNQPDAILFSFNEYEKLADVIEYLESLEIDDYKTFLNNLPIKQVN